MIAYIASKLTMLDRRGRDGLRHVLRIVVGERIAGKAE
jgi:hypothetical protein